jgi:hypothetical protein
MDGNGNEAFPVGERLSIEPYGCKDLIRVGSRRRNEIEQSRRRNGNGQGDQRLFALPRIHPTFPFALSSAAVNALTRKVKTKAIETATYQLLA